MKHKKEISIISAVTLVVFLTIFGYWAFYSVRKQSMSGNKGWVDTLQVNHFIDLAVQLKGSVPDSAAVYYRQAIDLLRPDSLNREVNHILGNCYVGIASIYCNNGNYPLSSHFDSLAMAGAQRFGDKDILSQALNIKGLLHFNQSDYQPALDYYSQAIGLAREAGNRKVEAKILTNIAIIHYLQGEVERSIGFFTQTMKVAQSINDDELLSGSYINMGLVASNSGKTDLAIENYRKAIEVYQRTNGKDGLILCYQNMGNIWFESGKFAEAIEDFQQSLKLALEIGDQSNIAKGYHNLGEVYAYMGDWEFGIDNYISSIEIKEKLNDLKGMSFDYNSLGTLNYQRKDYRKALDYYQQSLKISQEINYPQGVMTSYTNIANAYGQLSEADKGLGFAFNALKLHEELKTNKGIDELYSIIGMLYWGKKEYPNAEKYYYKAMETRQSEGDLVGLSNSLIDIAQLWLIEAKEQNGKARSRLLGQIVNNATQARNLAKEQKLLPVRQSASLLLQEAYYQLGDFSKALSFANEAAQIKDSLYNRSREEALALAEAKWNVQSHQRKIEELEKSQQMQEEIIQRKESESRLKGMVIYLLLAITIFMVGAAIILVIHFKKRKTILQERQMASIVSLRMQNARNRMSPHFFFNVLGSLPRLADQPELLQQRLVNLSLLLRKSLENIENTAIPLGEELNVVKAFVELQRDRVPAPFDVELTIDPKIDRQCPILAMIIQIPVENAIKHGLMPLSGEKRLAVSVAALSDGVEILVEDNGIGVTASAGRSTGTGTGLKVLLQAIALLNQWNKNKITFSIQEKSGTSSDNGRGTTVNIFIPDHYNFTNINYHEPNRYDKNSNY